MLKKPLAIIVAAILLNMVIYPSFSSAATIANGTPCSKVGASSSSKGKIYICRVNPSVPGASATTWTLKTCVTYWTAAQGSQNSINEQRSLVNNMSEPDKTNYNKQLDASQAQLNKVLSAIKTNHCKVGL
jgi:hypothetical protein